MWNFNIWIWDSIPLFFVLIILTFSFFSYIFRKTIVWRILCICFGIFLSIYFVNIRWQGVFYWFETLAISLFYWWFLLGLIISYKNMNYGILKMLWYFSLAWLIYRFLSAAGAQDENWLMSIIIGIWWMPIAFFLFYIGLYIWESVFCVNQYCFPPENKFREILTSVVSKSEIEDKKMSKELVDGNQDFTAKKIAYPVKKSIQMEESPVLDHIFNFMSIKQILSILVITCVCVMWLIAVLSIRGYVGPDAAMKSYSTIGVVFFVSLVSIALDHAFKRTNTK